MSGAAIRNASGDRFVFEKRANPSETDGFCSLCGRRDDCSGKLGVLVHVEHKPRPYHWICPECARALGRTVKS